MYITKKPKLAEFETDVEIVGPSSKEIDFIASHNMKCNYYYLGLAKCRDSLARGIGQQSHDEKHKFGFLPCKQLEDANWKCMTDKKNGDSLDEAPEASQRHVQEFRQCAYKQLDWMERCRESFTNAVREVYRQEDSNLK